MALFLFQCGDTGYFALSTDMTGVNIPLLDRSMRWFLRDELAIVRRREGADPSGFQDVVSNLQQRGFHIFRRGYESPLSRAA